MASKGNELPDFTVSDYVKFFAAQALLLPHQLMRYDASDASNNPLRSMREGAGDTTMIRY
ncbi:hypothetical protein J3458_016605 [Metarhizium acridum]|uniref:uncharacterized protein n=1 Tax=Metarhizium acridum TaxID=92637 RepID=UPI001C6B02DF|nr:hypothetical protein J3458_016605 [Metarhizium acridum]